MGRSFRRGTPRALALAISCALAGPAVANPNGPSVVSGQATFATQGKGLTVSNTPGAIIRWQGFSIAHDEFTRFVQQSSLSSVLNRVVGGSPSEILGRLSSNGRVFLINPSGIAFGAGATIDVGGLVASTLHLSDSDFLSGRLRFSGNGSEGAIVNRGEIVTPAGGSVYLVAPQIENSGLIHAPSGEVVLAAGSSVRLLDAAFPSIQVEVSAPSDRSVSLGDLAGAGSGKVFAFLVRNSGVVSASAAVGSGGRVALKSAGNLEVAGGSRIDANGPVAGTIALQAAEVALVAGAIEARASAGTGGSVTIESARVVVEPSATINVSGSAGGGEVAILGTDLAHFAGAIEARAELSGDGGKVEVSGKQALEFAGNVDTRALGGGNDGELLLDPARITIVAGSTGVPPALGDAAWMIAEDLGSRTLGALDLAALLATTSVTLQASEKITIAAGADIVAAPTAPRTLTLQAPDIDIQAAIRSNAAPVNLVLDAGAGRVTVAQQADLRLAGGTLRVAAQAVNVAPAHRPEPEVALARAAEPGAELIRMRAEIEAELARDRERVAAAMQLACRAPTTLRQGCNISTAPKRPSFGV